MRYTCCVAPIIRIPHSLFHLPACMDTLSSGCRSCSSAATANSQSFCRPNNPQPPSIGAGEPPMPCWPEVVLTPYKRRRRHEAGIKWRVLPARVGFHADSRSLPSRPSCSAPRTGSGSDRQKAGPRPIFVIPGRCVWNSVVCARHGRVHGRAHGRARWRLEQP